jgi:interleukin-like EMT inducer protein
VNRAAEPSADRPGRLLAVYGTFVLLVCLYTWPLVLHPGDQLRPYFDVHYFVWVLGWLSRRSLEAPALLFDANIFYPHGLSLAYSEPMLLPTLTFAPIYAASGNPILAYSLTVVLFQALAGWAAYHAARCLTGSRLAGWVGGVVFALSPFRTSQYDFAHMQLSFATPLAFLAFARFLERERVRDLAWALFFFWCQMVTVMYFGIPLSLMLAGLLGGVLLLRPRPTLRAATLLLVGGLVLVVALLPVAWPYLVARSELGFERSIGDTEYPGRTADVLTYVDVGPDSRFYQLADSGTRQGLFPGFTAVLLALLAFALPSRSAPQRLPPVGAVARRVVGGALAATLAAVAVFLATGGGTLGIASLRLRMTELDRPVVALLVLGAAWLALEGWAWARAGGERALTPREWAPLLALLALVFVLLSLGPVIRLHGRPVGVGLYAWLYDVFVPLRAMRVPIRIGFAAMFLVGLLAAFGLAALQARLAATRLAPALAVVPLLLLVEYLPRPLLYEVIRWDDPPPVYRWLARQPGDFAILEWPSYLEFPDATYGMWTLLHGKRLVNGSSGFDPAFTGEIRQAAADLPDPAAVARIRSVYPLGFVLGHLDQLTAVERARWSGFERAPPDGLRAAGRVGETVVLAPDAGPERGRHWERTFSTDLVTARPHARVQVGLSREDPEVQPIVQVSFNSRTLGPLVPAAAGRELRVELPPPYPRADRNVFRLDLAYRLRPGAAAGPRYQIGRTGVTSPVDLIVVSAGRDHGRMAPIRVNATDVSPDLRGYNVVVVDPASGDVRGRAVFDTFRARSEGARLAEFIRQVPTGAIVIAAVKDDGVGQLGDDAVQALRSVGGRLDPRGQLFVAHLLIGVKGAAPGTAIEAAGFQRLTRVVGRDRADLLLVTRDFGLE